MATVQVCIFNPVTTFIDQITAASTGPAAAGVPIVTNANGLLDTSLIGIGSAATAGQNMNAGQLVNLYESGGTLFAQLASAQSTGIAPSTTPYPVQAQGFANTTVFTGTSFIVNFFGTFKYVDGNSEFTASNIGDEVYLSAITPGGITLTPPVALEQAVGYVVGFTAPNIVSVSFVSGFQDFSHISGVNPIAKGGTGASTGAQALLNLIAGSPSLNEVLTFNGTNWVPQATTTAFSGITTGINNTAQTLTVGSTSILTFSGTGVINANQITGNPISAAAPSTGQVLTWTGAAWAPMSSAISFSGITTGINSTATMTVNTGASIVVTGTGVVEATQLWAVLVSSTPPTTGQVLTATSAIAANWQTPSGAPGGTNTAVQYNNSGAFGGDAAAFAWDDSTDSLTITGGTNSSEFLITGTTNSNGLEVSGDGADNGVYIYAKETGGGISIETDIGGFSVLSKGTIALTPFDTNLGMAIAINGAIPAVTEIRFTIGDSVGATVLDMGGTTATPELSFFGAALVPQPTITGSRNGNPGLASLLFALNTQGLVVDSTTAGSASTPGGANTNIQFNQSGAFGGSANFTWDYTNNIFTVDGNTLISASYATASPIPVFTGLDVTVSSPSPGGLITSAYGVNIQPTGAFNTAPTTATGLYIGDYGVSGAATTYGQFIDFQTTSTVNYALYIADDNAPTYIGSDVTIAGGGLGGTALAVGIVYGMGNPAFSSFIVQFSNNNETYGTQVIGNSGTSPWAGGANPFRGVYTLLSNTATSGTIAEFTGEYIEITNTTAGATVTSLNGLIVNLKTISAGQVTSTGVSVSWDTPTPDVFGTTAYAFYADTMPPNGGVVVWGFYSVDAPSYFGGNVLIDGHLNASSSAAVANHDLAGTIMISASTSATYNFATAFTSAPVVVVTPQSNPTATGTYWVTSTNLSFTVNVSISGTIIFNYMVMGNPN